MAIWDAAKWQRHSNNDRSCLSLPAAVAIFPMDIRKLERLRVIQQAVIHGYHVYSRHATEEMYRRKITRAEVETVLLQGEVIEHYRDRSEGEACLVLGRTEAGRVLHVACGFRHGVAVITAYEPDP